MEMKPQKSRNVLGWESWRVMSQPPPFPFLIRAPLAEVLARCLGFALRTLS